MRIQWTKSGSIYAIWALNVIAVLGRGEEIQNQAVGTVFYLWPQSKSLRYPLQYPGNLLKRCQNAFKKGNDVSLQVGGIVCNGVVR